MFVLFALFAFLAVSFLSAPAPAFAQLREGNSLGVEFGNSTTDTESNGGEIYTHAGDSPWGSTVTRSGRVNNLHISLENQTTIVKGRQTWSNGSVYAGAGKIKSTPSVSGTITQQEDIDTSWGNSSATSRNSLEGGAGGSLSGDIFVAGGEWHFCRPTPNSLIGATAEVRHWNATGSSVVASYGTEYTSGGFIGYDEATVRINEIDANEANVGLIFRAQAGKASYFVHPTYTHNRYKVSGNTTVTSSDDWLSGTSGFDIYSRANGFGVAIGGSIEVVQNCTLDASIQALGPTTGFHVGGTHHFE
jgi:hypothetical protein